MSTSDSFQQLAMRFLYPVQHDYEIIRGMMFADKTVAEWHKIAPCPYERQPVRPKSGMCQLALAVS